MGEHYNGPYKFIHKGANKTHKFQLNENGLAFDLTNVSEITFIIKNDNSESATTVFTCTMTGTDVVRQAPYTSGIIHAYVIPDDTSGKTSGRKVYYIHLVDSGANVVYFGKGIYEIIRT